jgi:lipoprotein-releasing system permease protein
MMGWSFGVALRYLRSKKSSQFLSFISLISVLGIMVGVTALIVVLSVMDGFESQMKQKLMATDLHVLITPQSAFTAEDKLLQNPKFLEFQNTAFFKAAVLKAEPVIATEAVLKSGQKITGVQVKGVRQQRYDELQKQLVEKIDATLTLERSGPEYVKVPGVFIGQEMSYDLGILPGDSITLVSPTEMQGPLGSIPKLKNFKVMGIYQSGLPEQELHTVYALDQDVRSFLGQTTGPGRMLSQLEISLKDFDASERVAHEAGNALGAEYKVQDWRQMNASLFYSLRLERIAMFVILAMIVVVASFNIVTTLTLMVLEKKREIAILKTMGATPSALGRIFLFQGAMIGTVGIGAGVLLALGISLILKKSNLIVMPDIYYDRTLPVAIDPLYYAGISLSAFVIVLIACRYPAHKAASLDPLDGIRS